MAYLLCLTSLMLVMLMTIGVVQSGPRKTIVRRQAIDTSHISEIAFIECLSNPTESQCDNIDNFNNINDIPVPDVAEVPGCQCVHMEQCLDNKNPSATLTDCVDTSPDRCAARAQEGQCQSNEAFMQRNCPLTCNFCHQSAPPVDDGLLTIVNVRTSCPDPLQSCCININPNINISPATLPPPITQPTCGHLNPQGVSTTFLGFQDNQAQFGQFPWMAVVMDSGIPGTEGENVYLSGGSLIHPGVVMTVAHYMVDKEAHQLVVRLGEWNLRFDSETIPHQEIKVKRIARHPNFVNNQLTYDIALLFLERNAVLGPTVDTICLPDPFETFDGASCYSSGWGKNNFGGTYQEVLKSLTLPVVDHQQCQNALRRTRLGNTFTLHKSFMCAGGHGLDTCTGDGGSPLVCPMKANPSTYVQVGLVAWGIGCGEEGNPGVYASVSEAVSWIGQELQTNMNIDFRGGQTISSLNVDVRVLISKKK